MSEPADSDLDGILVEESGGEDDGAFGLELDDTQAEEIRAVFLTTLPQYLEPIDQLIHQLFSGEDEDVSGTRRALDAALKSISEAAERIGVADVQKTMEQMREQLLLLDEDEPDPGLEEELLATLRGVGEIAGGSGAETGPPKRTIVSAFSEVGNLDRSLLERFTAAGLVTVDQLEMATVDEIAAVSGLEIDAVNDLLKALSISARTRPPRRSSATAPFSEASADAAERTEDEVVVGSGDVASRVKSQVDAEAALDETRVEVAQLRARLRELGASLALAEQERDSLRTELAEGRDRVTIKIGEVARARTERDAVEKEVAGLQQELRRLDVRARQVEARASSLTTDNTESLRNASALVDWVQRLLETSRRASGPGATAGHGGGAEGPSGGSPH